jgi:cytochrome c peroxidase
MCSAATRSRSSTIRRRSPQSQRSATKKYRTTPLRALFQHAPYFHDGSARDLSAVVEHYNRQLSLNLTAAQKADLVEFLKSL